MQVLKGKGGKTDTRLFKRERKEHKLETNKQRNIDTNEDTIDEIWFGYLRMPAWYAVNMMIFSCNGYARMFA